MVEKILNIIEKIGIVVISTIVLLIVFIQVRSLYTDILYPKAYAKLFIKGDEKIVDAYNGSICLDTDIVSQTYRWKNITPVHSFNLSNTKSHNSKDCFFVNTIKEREYIVRLKTDNKTINYIIKTYNRPEIYLSGVVNSVIIQEDSPKLIAKINAGEVYAVSYDESYYNYSSNFEISKNFSLYSTTELESIIIEGYYMGIRGVADIVFNNLDTGEQYTCDEVIMSGTLGEIYKMQGSSSMICPAMALKNGDNHLSISAIDKLGRKIYWHLILTKYSSDIFKSKLKLSQNSVNIKYHPITITAAIDVKQSEVHKDISLKLARLNHDGSHTFIANMSPIKSDNSSDVIGYEAQFESDYEEEVYDVIAKIAQRRVRFNTTYRVVAIKDDIEFMSKLSAIEYGKDLY